jgi:hypothetical protein
MARDVQGWSLDNGDPYAHGAFLLWIDAAAQLLGLPSQHLLKFDIVEEENVDRTQEITTHPVEVGADVADHYRRRPRAIRLHAFISQEPLDAEIYSMANALLPVELVLPNYVTSPNAFSPGALALINPLGTVVRTITQLGNSDAQSFQSLQSRPRGTA